MPLITFSEISREADLPVYVTAVAVEDVPPAVSHRMLARPMLLLTLRGKGTVKVGGKLVELEAGSVFFLNENVEFSGRPSEDEPWTTDCIFFDFGSKSFQELLFTTESYLTQQSKEYEKLHQSFYHIYDSISLDSRYGGFTASAALYELLISLHRTYLNIPEWGRKNEAVISAVVACINERYREDLTLEELCAAAGGLSEQYLCRLFKESTGMRPMEYILKKRISIARFFLERTDRSIPEIAEEVGFHNTSYFYRSFKKFTGTSPLNYRQQMQLWG